jgi:hypothetical protein
MKKSKKISLIFLLFWGQFFICCTNSSSNITSPKCIFLSKPSPDKNLTAIIYTWEEKDKVESLENILGNDSRFVLGFSNKKSKWLVDFELSEGFGTYEGCITGIEWINEYEVLVKRRISDSQKDIKYNIRLNKWTLVK